MAGGQGGGRVPVPDEEGRLTQAALPRKNYHHKKAVSLVKYDFSKIEKKWQTRWREEKTFRAVTGDTTRPKWYGLVEFPYPSGQGLHVGHARPYTAMDVIARKKRMDGYNVLFPIGYDAFGLPTENYAIKNHIHPAKVTEDNIKHFHDLLEMLR